MCRQHDAVSRNPHGRAVSRNPHGRAVLRNPHGRAVSRNPHYRAASRKPWWCFKNGEWLFLLCKLSFLKIYRHQFYNVPSTLLMSIEIRFSPSFEIATLPNTHNKQRIKATTQNILGIWSMSILSLHMTSNIIDLRRHAKIQNNPARSANGSLPDEGGPRKDQEQE